MNSIKSLAFAGLAAAALMTTPAFGTTCPTNAPIGGAATQGSPTCVATSSPDAPNPGPTDLNAMFGPGGSDVQGTGLDIYNGQHSPNSNWQIGGTGGSFNIILKEIAGNANVNTFGIYDTNNPSNMLQLFGGTASSGAQGTLVYNGGGNFGFSPFGGSATYVNFTSASFGYYLNTPQGIFYSNSALNNSPDEAGNPYTDGMHHMVAYEGGNGTKIKAPNGNFGLLLSNEFMLAWEDQAFKNSDLDYNDFIVLVESVHSVPEPAALGMFGLGALLIGAFVGLRRREEA